MGKRPQQHMMHPEIPMIDYCKPLTSDVELKHVYDVTDFVSDSPCAGFV